MHGIQLDSVYIIIHDNIDLMLASQHGVNPASIFHVGRSIKNAHLSID